MQEESEPTVITWAEVRAAVAKFEAQHPGIDASNFRQAFLDEAGCVVQSPELDWIESLYTALEVAPSGEPLPGFGFVSGP